jgi:hypothetical protein
MRFRLRHLLALMTITALLLCVLAWYKAQFDALNQARNAERVAEQILYLSRIREIQEQRDAERVIEQMLDHILKIQEKTAPSPTISSERMLIDNE